MEIFSALLALCVGNSPVTGEFPAHKGQWRETLMFSLICAGINGSVHNREAGYLRRHRTNYDVTVMCFFFFARQVVIANHTEGCKLPVVSLMLSNDKKHRYYCMFPYTNSTPRELFVIAVLLWCNRYSGVVECLILKTVKGLNGAAACHTWSKLGERFSCL